MAWFVAPPVLSHLAGARYLGLENLVRAQCINMGIVLLANPLGVLLLAQGRTRAIALLNGAQLLLALTIYPPLTTSWGALGANLATIAVNGLGLIVTMSLAFRKR